MERLTHANGLKDTVKNITATNATHEIQIPLELIEAVWVRDHGTPSVALMLRHDLVLVVRDGPPAWTLRAR